MKARKLNYRFHNPNTAEVTADILVKIIIEANLAKVDKAIQRTEAQAENKEHCTETYSA